jgi:hypothetical protein
VIQAGRGRADVEPGVGQQQRRAGRRGHSKYGYGRDDAPPGARLMQLRMFYLPDEPADPTAGS